MLVAPQDTVGLPGCLGTLAVDNDSQIPFSSAALSSVASTVSLCIARFVPSQVQNPALALVKPYTVCNCPSL